MVENFPFLTKFKKKKKKKKMSISKWFQGYSLIDNDLIMIIFALYKSGAFVLSWMDIVVSSKSS